MKPLDIDKYIISSTAWLQDYATKAGQTGYVIGVSGGVDSAVVSTLCARTGLPLLVIEMPIHQSPDQVTRARNHITWLKENFPHVASIEVDLSSTFDSAVTAFQKAEAQFPAALTQESILLGHANTRARLRMTTLYQFATALRRLVCGTGNKVEDFGIGYFSKFGDGGVDLSPIGDITKTEVWAVAAELGVNQEIIDAKPTDGLWAGSPSDEDQIGASYPELEWAMDFIETQIAPLGGGAASSSIDTIVAVVGKKETENVERKKEVMRIYMTRNRANKHKMDPIPVFSTTDCR